MPACVRLPGARRDACAGTPPPLLVGKTASGPGVVAPPRRSPAVSCARRRIPGVIEKSTP